LKSSYILLLFGVILVFIGFMFLTSPTPPPSIYYLPEPGPSKTKIIGLFMLISGFLVIIISGILIEKWR